jgi:Aspartyl protease
MNTQPELFALDEILARNSDSNSSDKDSSCSTTECSTSSEEEDFDSLDECLEAYSLAEYIRGQSNPNKKQRVNDYVDKDMRPLAFVRFNTSLGKPKPVTIKALLDSGASESIINKRYVSKLRVRNSTKTSTVWSTPGGDLHTSSKVKGQFTIPKLQDKKLIEWNLHVADNMGGVLHDYRTRHPLLADEH